MSGIKAFQPLRAPITAVLSIFIVFAVADLHGVGPEYNSTDSSLSVFAIIFWALCIGAAAWNSPQAQAASCMVFTITAFMATQLQSGEGDGNSDFTSTDPTLWALSGIMCGSTFATVLTSSRNSDRRPEEIDSIFQPDRAIISVLAPILPIMFLIAPSDSPSGLFTGNTGTALLMFLPGFFMAALAAISPVSSLSFLGITLTWIYVADSEESTWHSHIETVSLPLVAIAATAGLFTMYSYKKPQPATQAT
jgi:membrane protein